MGFGVQGLLLLQFAGDLRTLRHKKLKKIWKKNRRALRFLYALRILTPPMETPDPPSDTPGASKKVFLTPHDIPRILRVFVFFSIPSKLGFSFSTSVTMKHTETSIDFHLAPSMDRWNSGPARICWRQTNPGKAFHFFHWNMANQFLTEPPAMLIW